MRSRWAFVVAGLCVAALLAIVVAPHASSAPDGLERVAEDEGFLDTASGGHGGLAYGPLTGVVGLVVAFALVAGVLALTRRRRSRA